MRADPQHKALRRVDVAQLFPRRSVSAQICSLRSLRASETNITNHLVMRPMHYIRMTAILSLLVTVLLLVGFLAILQAGQGLFNVLLLKVGPQFAVSCNEQL